MGRGSMEKHKNIKEVEKEFHRAHGMGARLWGSKKCGITKYLSHREHRRITKLSILSSNIKKQKLCLK